MTEANIILTHNLSKRFGHLQALDSIDLSVQKGVLGVVGPNGAGKTTLLRTLLGLIRSTSGKAEVLGYDTRTHSAEIRNLIGVLHENPSFPKFMRTRRYLLEVIRLYGSRKNPNDLLEMVDLGSAKNRQIGQLSAGMKQRLGIALAFAGNPKIVFLDEPTSNLDVAGRNKILDLIVELYHESGVSFIIASHVLSELERVCSHVAFINQGRLLEHGLTNEIIEKYTADRFKVKCSDSHSVLDEIRKIRGVKTATIRGTSSFSVVISGSVDTVKEHIEKTFASRGERFYGMERAATLEDAFWEAVT